MTWSLLGALLVGLSLGLMGSGGSILTVPVLTYFVGQEEKVAIAGSLGIVGLIALAASIQPAVKRQVDYRSVLWFGLPGMLGTGGGAWLSQWFSGTVQLTVFAALMIVAGLFMVRPSRKQDPGAPQERQAAWKIVLEGLGVGVITGFVGVGGGFLIVPALVLLGGLPMHRAVGTSLLIIALKSFAGFWKYLDVLDAAGMQLDWTILATFSAVGIAGSFAGGALGARLPQELLRRGFAVFLFVIAALIVWDKAPELLAASDAA